MGYLKNAACWGPAPHFGRDVPTPYKHVLPHFGYHAEFDRCWSNGTNIRIEKRHRAPRVLPFKVTEGRRN